MKAVFNIPSLLAMAQHINYQPQLATALNALLRARKKDDYEIALQNATSFALGYEVKTVAELKDYGINPNSPFSAPLFQPLTLKIPDNKDGLLLDSAVVSFNMARNIVKTVVQGRDSTVKEFINNGDYAITISGIICSPGWYYPIDEIASLDALMKHKGNLAVNHEVLNKLGIYEIVIDSYDIPKTPQINCQTYSIAATSDIPVPLKIGDLPQSLSSPRF